VGLFGAGWMFGQQEAANRAAMAAIKASFIGDTRLLKLLADIRHTPGLMAKLASHLIPARQKTAKDGKRRQKTAVKDSLHDAYDRHHNAPCLTARH